MRERLKIPQELTPGLYELSANGVGTGLRFELLEALPTPVAQNLEFDSVRNYRPWSVRLFGRDLHPDMKLSLGGPTAPFEYVVESSELAIINLPSGFPAGRHQLEINDQKTELELEVIEPDWQRMTPSVLQFDRSKSNHKSIEVDGSALPPPKEDDENRYWVVGSKGAIAEAVVECEELEPESRHRLVISGALPRGKYRLRFGQTDTALAMEARRPWPRSVYALATLCLVAALGVLGFALKETFEPQLVDMSPRTVFDLHPQNLSFKGKYVESALLIPRSGGVLNEESAVRIDLESSGVEGDYTAMLPRLQAGEYALRPVGPFYSGDRPDWVLTVIENGIVVSPKMLHRQRQEFISLASQANYPIDSLSTLELSRPGSREVFRSFEIDRGQIVIEPREFAAVHEGEYLVSIDGETVGTADDSRIRIVGAQLGTIEQTEWTADRNGQIALPLPAKNLIPDLWIGLVVVSPEGSPELAHRLDYSEESFTGRVQPGQYSLAWGHDNDDLELIPGTSVTILPSPTLTGVVPDKIEPRRQHSLVVAGRNLKNLGEITLEPLPGTPGSPLTFAIDPARILKEKGLEKIRLDEIERFLKRA